MRKPYDPIADEEPHIVAEYHFPNCTAYIADNYLETTHTPQGDGNTSFLSISARCAETTHTPLGDGNVLFDGAGPLWCETTHTPQGGGNITAN